MAAGDHVGWKDLIQAAAPVARGQAMDVLEIMLSRTTLISPCNPVTLLPWDHAAKMHVCSRGC